MVSHSRARGFRHAFAGALCVIATLAFGCGGTGTPADTGGEASRDVVMAMETGPDSATDDVGTDVGMDTPTSDTLAPDAIDVRDAAMDSPGDTARTDVSPSDAPAGDAIDPYPPGPYGITEGSTLANLEWDGYVNNDGTVISNTLPFVRTSMAALRTGRRGYALVHLSEFF